MTDQTQDIYKQLTTARLPALPQVLLQILELCDRDEVGLSEIGEVVANDAGIAAKIVSIANSSYYRNERALSNIEQSLSVLGTAVVRRLALNQSVIELFGNFKRAEHFDLRHFWFHGLCVAVTARNLAQRLKYHNTEEAYLAGLLHDVGQLALLCVAPERYLPMFDHSTGEHDLMRQEQSAFGLTHAEIGAWLAERWNLHPFFVDAILYHHESLARVRDAHQLVQITMLANLLHTLSDHPSDVTDADLAFWGLDLATGESLAEEAVREARDIAGQLGIELPAEGDQPSPSDNPDQAARASLAEAVSIRMEAQNVMPEPVDTQAISDAQADLLRSASLLFEARTATLFLAQDDTLRGQDVLARDARLGEIRVHLPNSDSKIALAYQGEICMTGEDAGTGSLADAQLLRVLDSQRLLCLPLAHGGARLGALIIGLDAMKAALFMQRRPLLVTFAREAGRRLALAGQQLERRDAARQDMTERYQLHARKVVHEASNPISVVRNYLVMLREQLGDQDKARQDLDLIESELRRVATILQQMKQVDQAAPAPGSGPTPNPNKMEINPLIDEVVRFCRMGKREVQHITLTTALEDGLPPVLAQRDKLKQILMNLIFNAAEALTGKGEVTVSTARWRSAKGQDAVEIAVSDNGPGLPQAVIDNLYQPVASSKGGPHQGLGLAIVGKLVEELDGVLQCKSSQTGTSFKILLPTAILGEAK